MQAKHYLKGTGMTRFDNSPKTAAELAYDAAFDALKSSGLYSRNIDAAVITTLDFAAKGNRQSHFSPILSSLLKSNIPIIRTTAACAGGGAAFWTANHLLNNEGHNNILVIAVEKLTHMTTDIITEEFMIASDMRWEQTEGMNFPAQNALIAQQYMLKYPETTMDDLALIAFKNHENAALNPKAKFYKKQISLEQIKNSAVVASPLRLFDCSISVDGAAAAVISKDRTDIEIAGSSLITDYSSAFERDTMTSFKATRLAANNAYKQAGITADDIDFAELHDAFTSVELISYEDLGFCREGNAHKLIRSGKLNLHGKMPVNTSGGLKAKGHPVSATGSAQVVEIAEQMRNLAGQRQIKKTNTGLTQNIGGAGSSVVVNVFRKR